MSSGSRVGFIGAGQMGLPMVRRLVHAGHEVTAFARRSEVRDECAALDAAAVAEVGDAVVDADAVIVCLFADARTAGSRVRGPRLCERHAVRSPANRPHDRQPGHLM